MGHSHSNRISLQSNIVINTTILSKYLVLTTKYYKATRKISNFAALMVFLFLEEIKRESGVNPELFLKL